MAYLVVNGFKVYYEVYDGLVDKDTLLIHGNLACSIWWHPVIDVLKAQALPKKGRLVCMDWRGCGQSKGLTQKSEIKFETFAEDVLSLIKYLELKDVQVVGHSTGGLIAMLAILKDATPFASLVLLDSIGPKGIVSPVPQDVLLAHFHALSQDENLSNTTIAATIEGVDTSTDYFKALAKATFNVDEPVWVGVPEELCNNVDITHRMSEITLPTLILHGEKDMVLPLEGSIEMHELLPQSELVVLKDNGHSLSVEDPKKYVELLQDFNSKLEH
ncbi:MAG: alpha/beta hydrolase [Bdellovibrionaceae bacterium]|nr:alpha/beta hydrolase [Pseudobdellovibrionaceae bacterium]